MSKLLSKIELLECVESSVTHCQYIHKLNIILYVWFDLHKDKLIEWLNASNPRDAFLSTYNMILFRVFLSELNAILDIHDPSEKQYNINSIISQTEKYLSYNSFEFFLNKTELLNITYKGFIFLNPSLFKPELIDQEILDLLRKENKRFRKKYTSEIRDMNRLRNGMLSHLQYEIKEVTFQVNFLQHLSSWCIAFTSLIANLIHSQPNQEYIDINRKNAEIIIINTHTDFLTELLSK